MMPPMKSTDNKIGQVRQAKPEDVQALKSVIDANGLFPADMLDSMIANFFASNSANEMWFTIDADGPKAVAYCAPERMTQGTWNLFLIAVHPNYQRKGYGAILTRHIERQLKQQGERVLLIETSGLPEFEGTRSFYDHLGYEREASIRDFYAAGEDKIVFRKAL
jgi:ribosomal protein S18 acetylase RimI-like enzyme